MSNSEPNVANVLLRRILLRVAPTGMLHWVKRIHYLRAVRDMRLADEPDLEVVRHLVRPGDRVLDVGANVGDYTRFLSEWVGPMGRVHSIEPMPETFAYLQNTVTQLGLTNVECCHWAASDREGVAQMQVPSWPSGGDNLYQAQIVEASDEPGGHSVSTRCLDTALGALGPFSFVKCDVEGHELACVRGALQLTKESRPAWLVEVSHDPDTAGSDGEALFEWFDKLGYAAYWFDKTSLRPRRRGDSSVNYFFLQDEQFEAVRAVMTEGTAE